MNTLKSVFKRVSKIETPQQVELSEVEKVELARKPQSILGEVARLDNKMRSEQDKIDRAYGEYKRLQMAWVKLMQDINSELDKLEDDLYQIGDKAKEIGVDPKAIDGYSKVEQEIIRVGKIANQSKTLYPSV